jgi:hypothetical protein
MKMTLSRLRTMRRGRVLTPVSPRSRTNGKLGRAVNLPSNSQAETCLPCNMRIWREIVKRRNLHSYLHSFTHADR